MEVGRAASTPPALAADSSHSTKAELSSSPPLPAPSPAKRTRRTSLGAGVRLAPRAAVPFFPNSDGVNVVTGRLGPSSHLLWSNVLKNTGGDLGEEDEDFFRRLKFQSEHGKSSFVRSEARQSQFKSHAHSSFESFESERVMQAVANRNASSQVLHIHAATSAAQQDEKEGAETSSSLAPTTTPAEGAGTTVLRVRPNTPVTSETFTEEWSRKPLVLESAACSTSDGTVSFLLSDGRIWTQAGDDQDPIAAETPRVDDANWYAESGAGGAADSGFVPSVSHRIMTCIEEETDLTPLRSGASRWFWDRSLKHGVHEVPLVPRWRKIVRFACGDDHVLAMTGEIDGAFAYAWGSNTQGQCGVDFAKTDGLAENRVSRPTRVTLPEDRRSVQLACGRDYSVLVALERETGAHELFVFGAAARRGMKMGQPGRVSAALSSVKSALSESAGESAGPTGKPYWTPTRVGVVFPVEDGAAAARESIVAPGLIGTDEKSQTTQRLGLPAGLHIHHHHHAAVNLLGPTHQPLHIWTSTLSSWLEAHVESCLAEMDPEKDDFSRKERRQRLKGLIAERDDFRARELAMRRSVSHVHKLGTSSNIEDDPAPLELERSYRAAKFRDDLRRVDVNAPADPEQDLRESLLSTSARLLRMQSSERAKFAPSTEFLAKARVAWRDAVVSTPDFFSPKEVELRQRAILMALLSDARRARAIHDARVYNKEWGLTRRLRVSDERLRRVLAGLVEIGDDLSPSSTRLREAVRDLCEASLSANAAWTARIEKAELEARDEIARRVAQELAALR